MLSKCKVSLGTRAAGRRELAEPAPLTGSELAIPTGCQRCTRLDDLFCPRLQLGHRDRPG